MSPRDNSWRPVLRELHRARPDDLAGVLERLSETERAKLAEVMEGRSATPAPQKVTETIETVRLAGLSNALAARLFPSRHPNEGAPRLTKHAEATLRELAEAFARSAIGAGEETPVRIQPGRRQLFAALLDRSYDTRSDQTL